MTNYPHYLFSSSSNSPELKYEFRNHERVVFGSEAVNNFKYLISNPFTCFNTYIDSSSSKNFYTIIKEHILNATKHNKLLDRQMPTTDLTSYPFFFTKLEILSMLHIRIENRIWLNNALAKLDSYQDQNESILKEMISMYLIIMALPNDFLYTASRLFMEISDFEGGNKWVNDTAIAVRLAGLKDYLRDLSIEKFKIDGSYSNRGNNSRNGTLFETISFDTSVIVLPRGRLLAKLSPYYITELKMSIYVPDHYFNKRVLDSKMKVKNFKLSKNGKMLMSFYSTDELVKKAALSLKHKISK